MILNNFVIGNFSLKPLVFKKQGLLTDGRTDGHTDGRTDIRMDGRMDKPSYSDARTHLKRGINVLQIERKNDADSRNVFAKKHEDK